jgi:hypothetical protein
VRKGYTTKRDRKRERERERMMQNFIIEETKWASEKNQQTYRNRQKER